MKKLFGKLRLRMLLLALLIGMNFSVFSQPQKPLPDNIPVIQSPQIWSFMKYGNMSSVDLYTGTVATSIPIYTYKDNDFEIPISINYASSGFIPNVPTGILGLGWYLNAGGCITREVRGVPDEKQTPVLFDAETKSSVSYDGYLSYHCINSNYQNWGSLISENYVTPYNPMLSYDRLKTGTNRIETLSDIYHFRFGNHKGSFCFGPNHEVYVYDTDRPFGEYKIDYRINDVDHASASAGILQIDITTGDGYIYTFDGRIDSSGDDQEIDYSTIKNVTSGTRIQNDSICKTFVLKKILSPNGRYVKFEYNTRNIYSVRPYAYNIYDKNYTSAKGYKEMLNNISHNSILMWTCCSSMDLACININDQVRIGFEYKKKDWDFFEHTNINGDPFNSIGGFDTDFLLSNIKISTSDGEESLKKWTFDHKIKSYNGENEGNRNAMTLLRTVGCSDGTKYEFSYYNEDEKFTYHGTPKIDHWGYYNGNNTLSLSTFIPEVEIEDYSYTEIINTAYREPDANYALYGMLKKIIYPTGGYTEYKYEGHTYYKYVGFDSLGLPALADDGIMYNAGGLRIKEIIDYSPGSEIIIKNYKYDDNSISSGILLYYPRYFFSYILAIKEDAQKTAYKHYGILSSTDVYATNIEKYHIGYSKVTESLSDGSFTEYYFSDYVDFPDIVDATLYDGPYYGYIFNVSPVFIDNYMKQPISYQSRRGKLKSKRIFSADSLLVRKFTYKYSDDQVDKYAEGLDVLCTKCYVVKRHVGNFPLVRECQTDYYDNDSLVVNTLYSYNKLGQPVKSEVKLENPWLMSSQGKYFFYPSDFLSADLDTTNDYSLDAMISRNMIKTPLVEISTIEKYGDNYITDIYRRNYIYDQDSNVKYPILSSVLRWSVSDPEVLDIYKNYYNDYNYDDCYRIFHTFDVYDKYGNVIQITSQDNIKTVYIWGYNGRYPIAVIENSDLNTIKKINGFADIETTPFTAGLNDEQETQLRQISDAHITTYTYKPLVGITSVTDPSERRTNYDYDSFGRLITIKDEDGNILENYDYRYKEQIQ